MIQHRGPLRTVTGDDIICRVGSVLRIHRTDSNYIGIVARSCNRTVAVQAVIVFAATVASCHDYDQSSLPRRFHCLAERILRVAFKYRPSQRQVNDTNAVCIFEGDCTLQGRDHVGILSSAIHVEHLQINQLDARGNTVNFRRIAQAA